MFDTNKLVAWSNGEFSGGTTLVVGGISTDSRTIRAGELYVALDGDRFDGHDFIDAAVRAGACAVMLNKEKLGSGYLVPTIAVDDTRKALGSVARGYRLDHNAEIIGITGSAGKTTVKEMTAQMLSTSKKTASTFGNLNNDIGLPVSILSMDDMAEVGVFEIGSNHPGEIAGLCEILNPDWGVVTNVGVSHIEYFGTLDEIAKEKASLLERLPSTGKAVLDNSELYFDRLSAGVMCELVTVSIEGASDYRGAWVDGATNLLRIEDRLAGDVFECPCPLPGTHNAKNMLMAAAVARGFGVPWTSIAEAMVSYEPLPMRWVCENVGAIEFINDSYNANPLSMRASIDTFSSLKKDGDKWLLLGGMMELGEYQDKEHLELGKYIANVAGLRGLVAVGAEGSLIADGAERGGMSGNCVIRVDSKSEAAVYIKNNLQDGSIVLLKGSRSKKMEDVVSIMKGEL